MLSSLPASDLERSEDGQAATSHSLQAGSDRYPSLKVRYKRFVVGAQTRRRLGFLLLNKFPPMIFRC